MLYGFGAFLVIYLAGVLIYQVVLWIQKWKRKKKDGYVKISGVFFERIT